MRLLILEYDNNETRLSKIVYTSNYNIELEFNELKIRDVGSYSNVTLDLRNYLMLNIKHNLTIVIDEYNRIKKWEENKL